LATHLVKEYDVEVHLIESRGGAYEITVDGELFFSKLLTGHFPNDDRIIQDLAGHE
jgi:selT/selW/selH-like putative selenoprotein